MKKTIIVISSILLVLIVLAVFILPRVISLERFKGRIENTLEASLNRKVTLGDISLTFWPGIGAEIEEVRIANLSGFLEKDFVSLKSLQVLIKILPLFTGNIEVDKFILIEPNILIEKNRVGKFNFADLMEEEKKAKEEKKVEEEKGAGFIKGLMVSKASVHGGELHYLDYSKPKREELYVEDIDLNLKDISINKPISFDLSFRLKETPKKVILEGTVGPIGKEMNVMEVPIAAALETKEISLEPFSKFLRDGGSISGLLSLSLKVDGRANEALKLDLASSMRNFSYALKGEVFVRNTDIAFKEKGALNLKEEKVTVETGELSLGDALVKMKGAVTGIKSGPNLDINITSKALSLSGWDRTFPTMDFLAGLGGTGDIDVSLKGGLDSVTYLNGTVCLNNLNYSDKKTQKKIIRDLTTCIRHALSIDLNNSVVDIKDLRVIFQENPITIKGTISQFKQSQKAGVSKPQPHFDLTIAAKGVSLSGLNERFPATDALAGLKGTGSITWLVKGQVDSNVLLSGDTSLEHLTYIDKKSKETLIQDLDIHTKHSLALDFKRDVLDIRDLTMTLLGNPVAIKGTISQLKKSPSIYMSIEAQKILLSKWRSALPPLQEMADVKGDMDINANLSGRLNKLVDIKFLLNSSQLEINRVKKKIQEPRQSKADKETEAVSKKKIEEKDDILGLFDLEGKITIAQGRFEDIRFQDFAANLSKKGMVFDLTDMAFDTFKGRVVGRGRIDMTEKTPRYSLTTKIDRMDTNEIYNTFASPKDLLFGLLLADFTATGVGLEQEELTRNIDGSGQLELKDGRLTSFNLLKEIGSIADLLGVEGYGKETRFDDLSMDFKIKSGKILTDNLSLTTKDLDLKASGNIGLDKTIDLSANAWLSSALASKMPKFTKYTFERDEKGRVLIPFRLAGNLMKPKLTLNTQALKTQVEKRLKEEVEKGIEKIPVEKEIKGILKDVLGR